MPTIPSYTATTADALDTDDLFIMDVDGATRKITVAELKKIVNRAEVNTQTGSYTLVLADEGKVVRMNVAGANNLTVPPNSSVAFAIGTQIVVRQAGAGLTSLVAGSGDVNLNSPSLELNGQNTAAVLHKVATNTWDVYLGAAGEVEPDIVAPTVSSATAINSTTIRVVFSETVTATNVGWSFKKNGVAHNPSAVSGSGTNTLDFTVGTMLNTDTILRSYNSGTGNTMDGSSNELVSFTDQAVTNSISDVGAPTLSTATVENGAPADIVLTYSEALDTGEVPADSDYGIDVDAVAATITNVSVLGSTVTITIATPVAFGEVVTVTYTPNVNPANPRIQDLAGNAAAALTDEPVTNNVASGSYDTDAQNYIDAVVTAGGTLNTTKQDGIDAFVVAMKADGLWAKGRQFGLLCHGSFAASKINMKSPGTKDLTSTNGTITYNGTGATGNGTTGYINTGIVPRTEFGLNNHLNSLALYCRTAASADVKFDMGSGIPSPNTQHVLTAGWGTARGVINGDEQANAASTDSQGFFVVSRRSDTDLELYKNGTSIQTNTVSNSTPDMSNVAMYLCAYNDNGTASLHSPRELSFWWVGDDLTDAEVADFNTNFQALKTAMGF
jgi:uncharacterized repeat protein (TIGR02059 family)